MGVCKKCGKSHVANNHLPDIQFTDRDPRMDT